METEPVVTTVRLPYPLITSLTSKKPSGSARTLSLKTDVSARRPSPSVKGLPPGVSALLGGQLTAAGDPLPAAKVTRVTLWRRGRPAQVTPGAARPPRPAALPPSQWAAAARRHVKPAPKMAARGRPSSSAPAPSARGSDSARRPLPRPRPAPA